MPEVSEPPLFRYSTQEISKSLPEHAETPALPLRHMRKASLFQPVNFVTTITEITTIIIDIKPASVKGVGFCLYRCRF